MALCNEKLSRNNKLIQENILNLISIQIGELFYMNDKYRVGLCFQKLSLQARIPRLGETYFVESQSPPTTSDLDVEST